MRVDEEMMHIRGQKTLLVCWSKLAASVAVKDLNEILEQIRRSFGACRSKRNVLARFLLT